MNGETNLSRNAFMPITEKPLTLNFSQCRNLRDIHLLLKEKFVLPEYYGENWNTLWDCLRYLWIDDKPIQINIHGIALLDDERLDDIFSLLHSIKKRHKSNTIRPVPSTSFITVI